MGTESDASGAEGEDPLPTDVVDEAARLTRQAREAERRTGTDGTEEAAVYRSARDDLLAEQDYAARVREDDDGAVLVLYPETWLEDGTARVDRIEDLSRGVEVSLSGAGDGRDWAAVEAHNREVARAVEAAHGDPHGATAHALADFASNHYAKRLEALTADERREFREEYFPRNAWPTRAQRQAVTESIRLALEVTTSHDRADERE